MRVPNDVLKIGTTFISVSLTESMLGIVLVLAVDWLLLHLVEVVRVKLERPYLFSRRHSSVPLVSEVVVIV